MSKELKKVTELVMQTPVGDRGQNKRKAPEEGACLAW